MTLPLLKPSMEIRGKWNGNRYSIVGKIGEGAIGAVYKVRSLSDGKSYALKLSDDNLSLNREYQLLGELKDIASVVKVYDLDDLEIGHHTFYFIILEYITGSTLKKYLEKNKLDTLTSLAVMTILIKNLDRFHKKGYVLGDLKLDNMMIDEKNKCIRIIDLGGVVKLGEAIKEFTPTYDRASWRQGKRVAEVSYDIFSMMIVSVQVLLGIDPNPRKQTVKELIGKIKYSFIDWEIKGYIIEGLKGTKKSAEDFANQFGRLYNKEENKKRDQRRNHMNRTINLIFWGSLSLFIVVFTFFLWS